MNEKTFTITGMEDYSTNREKIDVYCNNLGDVSDGHHTMTELYNHRHALFCALIKAYDTYVTLLHGPMYRCWKSKKHEDGTMYEGWFIAGISRKLFDGSIEDITYHLPLDWWDRLKCIEIPFAPKFDGHTSNDVIDRLLKL